MPNMTSRRSVAVRSVILALLCLQQSLMVNGFLVDGLENAGFFNVEKSIPDIRCGGTVGVQWLTSDLNCASPIDVDSDNDISNIDSDADQGDDTYKIEPLNLTSYAIFCLENSLTECFSAMTYILELSNTTDSELQCRMNFTAGDKDASSDKRPDKIIWKKNDETLQSIALPDTAFKEITDESTGPSRVFSVSHTLAIDRSNSTSAGEYECIYSYKKQYLASDNPVQITGAPEVSITFKLQTDDEKPNEEQNENDDAETQYTDGDKVNIACQAAGYPRPTVRWLHEGKPLDLDGVEIKVKETADYVISSFTIENLDDSTHRGNYSCIAENGIFGEHTEKFRILHARDRLAPLWPFIGIVAQVIVLAVVIAIGEKFRKKKVAEKLRRTQLSEHQPGTSDGNKSTAET